MCWLWLYIEKHTRPNTFLTDKEQQRKRRRTGRGNMLIEGAVHTPIKSNRLQDLRATGQVDFSDYWLLFVHVLDPGAGLISATQRTLWVLKRAHLQTQICVILSNVRVQHGVTHSLGVAWVHKGCVAVKYHKEEDDNASAAFHTQTHSC